MSFFARFYKAIQESRRREADRVICRNWHLVEQARSHQSKRASEAAKYDAPRLTPASVSSILSAQPSNKKAFVMPQRQRPTAKARQYDEQDYDNHGVLVVASVWLLFYALSFSELVVKQGTNVLASFLHSLS